MFNVCLCYAALSVPCSLVVICLERTGLLALLCAVFFCVFLTFPYGVPGNKTLFSFPLVSLFRCVT